MNRLLKISILVVVACSAVALTAAQNSGEQDSYIPGLTVPPDPDALRPAIETYEGFNCVAGSFQSVATVSKNLTSECMTFTSVGSAYSQLVFCDDDGNVGYHQYYNTLYCEHDGASQYETFTFATGACINVAPPSHAPTDPTKSIIYRCKKEEARSAFEAVETPIAVDTSLPVFPTSTNCFFNNTGCGVNTPSQYVYSQNGCKEENIENVETTNVGFPTGQCFYAPHHSMREGDRYHYGSCGPEASYTRKEYYNGCEEGLLLTTWTIHYELDQFETCKNDRAKSYRTSCNKILTPTPSPVPSPGPTQNQNPIPNPFAAVPKPGSSADPKLVANAFLIIVSIVLTLM